MSESVLIFPNSMDSIPADKVLWSAQLDLQKRGIRVFECLLDSQRESALFVAPGGVLICSLSDLARDLRHGKQRVAPIYHDSWTTTTTDRRQAFSFRVIGSSSARIEERPDRWWCHRSRSFREPLLGHGLLGELDISLCNDVVVGLITCGRLVLGQGAKVLSGSARGYCPQHQRRGRWKAVRSSGS